MRKTTLFLIIAVIGLLVAAASILLPVVSAHSTPDPTDSSVAIIGGADGPTAVYVTSILFTELYFAHYLPVTLVGGGVLILGIVGFVVSRSKHEISGE